MIGWGNDNNNLVPVNLVYNDNGSLLTEENLRPVINLNGEILEYPDTRRLLVNLDYQSMVGYKDWGRASFGIPQERAFKLTKDGGRSFVNDLSGFTSTAVDDYAFGINPNGANSQVRGFWYLGSKTQKTGLKLPKQLNTQFSIGVTFTIFHNRVDWKNVWCVQDNTLLRLETQNNNSLVGLYAEGIELNSIVDTQITWGSPIAINVCVNGRNVKKYVNGKFQGEANLSADIGAWDILALNCWRNFRDGDYTNHIRYHAIRIGDTQWSAKDNEVFAKLDGMWQP